MITKRTALKAAVAMGAFVAYSGVVPGIGAFAQASLRVRRTVNDMRLDDPDLETYRDFVGLMRTKPESEPVSWLGFASSMATRTVSSIARMGIGISCRGIALMSKCTKTRRGC